ncbi:MAG: hypothetical protein ACK5NN_01445 [Sphingomonadaceae bacterium]
MILSALHWRRFGYRLHRQTLLGRSDLVFPQRRAALFPHDHFWRRRDCHLFISLSIRQEFRCAMIEPNAARERKQHTALLDAGWRIATVQKYAPKGAPPALF